MASRYPFSSFGLGAGTDPFALLQDEMDRLFGHTLGGLGVTPAARGGSATAMAVPRMDVTETSQELCIELDVPGVARDDLELSLDDDILTIRGQRKPAQRGEDQQSRVHVTERAYGKFERALRLPFAAEMDQCNASLRDGVLTITLAKTDTQRKARRIEIRGPQDEAAQDQRTQLAPGQTELLDAEKPAKSNANASQEQVELNSLHAHRQQGEQRAH